MAGVVDGAEHRPARRPPLPQRRRSQRRRPPPVGPHSAVREVLTGLRLLARDFPEAESIGIDTWAVDYGLLDDDGRLLAEPIAYRDDRTAPADRRRPRTRQPRRAVRRQRPPVPAVQHALPARGRAGSGPLWDEAAHVVLLPDLLAYWLTGELRTEATNASTTGPARRPHAARGRRTCSTGSDIPAELLPPLEPGRRHRALTVSGCASRPACAPAPSSPRSAPTTPPPRSSACPRRPSRFAYVASGTWSLVGLELAAPVITAPSRAANFTNEGGVDGRTRFLRNVGGLWLLQESLRAWAEAGDDLELASLLADAESMPAGGPSIDVDDPAFIPPGDMPDRIAAAVARHGDRVPSSRAATVRCILDSLAAAYARTVRQAADLAGEDVDVIHVVGGGSQNELLCQLTADLAGLPVIAGPVEATALGNVLVQARTHGAAPDSLEEIRANLAATQDLRRLQPS